MQSGPAVSHDRRPEAPTWANPWKAMDMHEYCCWTKLRTTCATLLSFCYAVVLLFNPVREVQHCLFRATSEGKCFSVQAVGANTLSKMKNQGRRENELVATLRLETVISNNGLAGCSVSDITFALLDFAGRVPFD